MASIANSKLAVFKQATPGDNGLDEDWQLVNVSLPGPTGGPANTVVESQRIDPDRNAPGSKLVGASSGLTIPFEAQVPTASTQAFWELLKASIYAGTAQATYANGANATWNTGSTTLTINASDQAALFSSSVEVGDVLQLYSNAQPTTKYYARVTAKNNSGSNTTSLTLDSTSGIASNLTDVRFKKGTTITNASTQAAFGILRAFIPPNSTSYDRWILHNQEAVEACNLTVNAQSLISGSFTTVGIGIEEIVELYDSFSPPVFTAEPNFIAAPTSDVLDGTNNMPFVRVAGASYTLQGLQIGWQNNSQTRRSIGTYAPQGISAGIFRGTGQFTAYFDDIVEFNKAIAGTGSSLYFVCEDSSDRALIISVPQIRYGNPTLPGQDRDIIATLPFSFEKDDVEGISIRISYIN